MKDKVSPKQKQKHEKILKAQKLQEELARNKSRWLDSSKVHRIFIFFMLRELRDLTSYIKIVGKSDKLNLSFLAWFVLQDYLIFGLIY